jgi:CheY-like chemotaxis protein/HPt (histidine-containing phosphotransfer) domain-containing protein
LGLAIVKQLVTLMGGNIELWSHPGKGSIFGFTAYFAQCNPVHSPVLSPILGGHEVESENVDHQPVGSAEVRILLVEDNPVNREVAYGMLEAFNCLIDTAENGREAVAATAVTDYALVFMDCQMPEMDGLAATRLIREHEAQRVGDIGIRRVPIVALTAHAMQGDRDLCLAAGMDDYLTKPYTLSQLEHVLARWLPRGKAEPVEGCGVTPSSPSLETCGRQATVPQRVGTRDDTRVDVTIIDQAALAAIRELQRPGHPDIFARILSEYIDASPAMIDRIRRAVLSKNAAELRASAHCLKSSSAQLGASVLAADCRELELMGAGQDLDRAHEILSELEQHYTAVCTAFQAELEKGRSAA